MASLGLFFANTSLFQRFHFVMKIRFDCLKYRCNLVTLEENCQMLIPILEMGQRSQHTAILAQGLKYVTIPKLAGQLQGISISIAACQSRGLQRLGAELRLMRLASETAMDNVGLRGALVGIGPDLSSISNLCQRFPQTAGTLLPSLQRIKMFLRHDKHASGHPLFTKATQETWWTWFKHGVGDLRTCKNQHPYSGMTMAHCPECGPEAEIEKVREVDANAVMKPQDFIAAMKIHSFDGSAYHTRK